MLNGKMIAACFLLLKNEKGTEYIATPEIAKAAAKECLKILKSQIYAVEWYWDKLEKEIDAEFENPLKTP